MHIICMLQDLIAVSIMELSLATQNEKADPFVLVVLVFGVPSGGFSIVCTYQLANKFVIVPTTILWNSQESGQWPTSYLFPLKGE